MKSVVLEMFLGVMAEKTSGKRFHEQSEQHFVKTEKAEMIMLLYKLPSMRYNGSRSIREHILKISLILSKLRTMKPELHEDMLVYLVLISLLLNLVSLR